MILLTGATGTIGQHAVAALKKANVPFKVATRSPGKVKDLQSVFFDLEKFETYLPALTGVEKVFFLQPSNPFQHGQTLQLVAAAKRAGVKQIVKLSVTGADSEPGISLGRQHRAAEREIRESGIPFTFLRPTFFMQNFVNFYGADPTKDAQVFLPHEDAKVAWVDAKDVGEVAAAALTDAKHLNKVYELTGGEALSTAEVLATLGQAFGRKYTYVNVPPEAASKAMTEQGAELWLVDGFAELTWTIRKGYGSQPATGVKDALGRAPRTFAEYAKDAAAALKRA